MRLFAAVHTVFALAFVAVGLLLFVVAVRTCWSAVAGGALDGHAAVELIEAMGLVAVAVVAVQMGQTIAEEKVVREAHVSAPTRVRRFLSRFVVIIVVALAVEGLVATMKALHEDMATLPDARARSPRSPCCSLPGECSSASTGAPRTSNPRRWTRRRKKDRKLG